jgi:hypothetical protein
MFSYTLLSPVDGTAVVTVTAVVTETMTDVAPRAVVGIGTS